MGRKVRQPRARAHDKGDCVTTATGNASKTIGPKVWALAGALLVTAGCAQAAPAAGGDARAGAALAATGKATAGVPACIACHGAKGEGNAAAGFPRLAGIGAAYLERQLDAFANGQRQNPVMQPIAKALQPAERRAVAEYYARQSFATDFEPPANVAATGVTLALRGRWERGLVPACVACHGPNGIGVGEDFPPLAGQSTQYIADQLRAWREGTRPPGPQALMQAVATKLTPEDAAAVAQYFGSMTPRKAPGKAKP